MLNNTVCCQKLGFLAWLSPESVCIEVRTAALFYWCFENHQSIRYYKEIISKSYILHSACFTLGFASLCYQWLWLELAACWQPQIQGLILSSSCISGFVKSERWWMCSLGASFLAQGHDVCSCHQDHELWEARGHGRRERLYRKFVGSHWRMPSAFCCLCYNSCYLSFFSARQTVLMKNKLVAFPELCCKNFL